MCSIGVIINRIHTAKPSSPIAVFGPANDKGQLSCMFADTIATRRLIEDPDCIGVFDCADSLRRVSALLKSKI
jgi:hypothetical protein